MKKKFLSKLVFGKVFDTHTHTHTHTKKKKKKKKNPPLALIVLSTQYM